NAIKNRHRLSLHLRYLFYDRKTSENLLAPSTSCTNRSLWRRFSLSSPMGTCQKSSHHACFATIRTCHGRLCLYQLDYHGLLSKRTPLFVERHYLNRCDGHLAFSYT